MAEAQPNFTAGAKVQILDSNPGPGIDQNDCGIIDRVNKDGTYSITITHDKDCNEKSGAAMVFKVGPCDC